jgi:hypothetical protein
MSEIKYQHRCAVCKNFMLISGEQSYDNKNKYYWKIYCNKNMIVNGRYKLSSLRSKIFKMCNEYIPIFKDKDKENQYFKNICRTHSAREKAMTREDVEKFFIEQTEFTNRKREIIDISLLINKERPND